MSKKTFWFRLGLYVLFGGLIPFLFLTFRFNLFSKVDSLSIGGWGIVAIIFISVFFVKMMKAVKKGLPFSIFTQILNGLCKCIVPLVASIFIVYYMRDCMQEVFQFLVVVLFCQIIAIPVNPLPQWIHDNKINEDTSNMKTILSSLGVIKSEEKK